MNLPFFSYIIRPPPTSTLFPYTTLFRSQGDVADRRGRDPRRADGHHDGPGPPRPDRKSTRLNSSHQIISYAVFCLKKKITHYRHTRHHCSARGVDGVIPSLAPPWRDDAA